ncbi:MAG: hypothetical protein ACKO6N_25505 [Myxococcota bacterium]
MMHHAAAPPSLPELHPTMQRWVWLPVSLISLLWLWPVWVAPERALSIDPYWEMAQQLGAGPWPFTNFGVGFPLLLALIQTLGGSPLVAVVLQKGLTVFTALTLAKLAHAEGVSPRVAVGAGLLFGLSPMVQVYSSVLLTETLYLFWVILGLRATQKALAAHRAGRKSGILLALAPWGLAGLTLGASSLTRGNGLLVIGLVIAYGGLILLKQRGAARAAGAGRSGWLKLGGLAGLALIFPLSMAWLNLGWYGTFKPTSSGDYNLGVLMIGPAMCQVEGKPVKASASIWLSDEQVAAAPNGFVLAQEVRTVALAWAKQHPVPLVKGTLKGTVNALIGPSKALLESLTGMRWLVGVSLTLRCLLALGVLSWGLSLLLRPHTQLLGFFVMGYVAVHILPAGAGGYARFGLPVELLSSIGLAQVIASGAGWFQQQRRKKALTQSVTGKDEA